MNRSPLRYRCNLGLWVVAGMMVLPGLTMWLLGPVAIRVSAALGG